MTRVIDDGGLEIAQSRYPLLMTDRPARAAGTTGAASRAVGDEAGIVVAGAA